MIDLKPNVRLAPLLTLQFQELRSSAYAKEEVELQAMRVPLTRIIEEMPIRELVQEP